MQEQMSDFKIKLPIRTVSFENLHIGGDTSFHHLKENSNQSETLYALEISIFNTDEIPKAIKNAFGNNLDKINLIEKANQSCADILCLKFNINESKEDIIKAKDMLKTLLPYIKKPLMIAGINKSDTDSQLLPELISVLDRECIIALAEEKSYKSIVPPVIKGNHILVIRTPIDINLAKEMNILTVEMGLNPDRILIDTDMGALGYGLEYGYSIMEKIKLAAFEGDKMLNMPLIAFVGDETFKTKEAKSEDIDKNWGELDKRAVMLEVTAGSAISAAGANIVVLNHPKSVETLKGLK